LSIASQCKLINLSRASYYRSVDAHIGTETAENLELMRLIDEEYTRHPFYGQPVDMWTRPTDQPAPCGTCGQAMDNKKTLSTAWPHSLASRPHTHRLNNNCFFF